MIKNYIKTEHKLEKKKSEEDLAIPKITTEMVIQSNSVNNVKEIFEEIKIEVKNSEEDLTVPRVKRHELPKSVKQKGNKNETNLKKHIKHEPPDDLSNSGYDEKVEVMKDSEEINYDPIFMEICNIKSKNEINLKQHSNSEHKHEPPDDLSDSGNDEKA